MGAHAPIFAAPWTPIYEGPLLSNPIKFPARNQDPWGPNAVEVETVCGSRTSPALPLPSALVQTLPQEQHTGPPSVPFEWNRRGRNDQAKLSFAP